MRSPSHLRSIRQTVLALFMATCSQATGMPARAVADEGQLNLLIIQTDEHNFRTLGCYRNSMSQEQALIWGPEAFVETPAIDSIARRGALCTSFYATSPVCTPSRASFFTGRYPQHTGSPQNDLPLDSRMVTFAQVLAEQGYRTGYAGKWHLDGAGKPQWAPRRQFGFADNRFMFNRGHWKKFELTSDGAQVGARKNGKPNYNLDGADEKTFSTDWLTDRAIDFITQESDQPFCYHLSLPDPHGPNTVRAPYDTMFSNMRIRPPLTFSKTTNNPKWAPASGRNGSGAFRADLMAKYFGMVRCIDDNVARILKTLEQRGILEKTVIVFTSDHGDLCFEHGRLNKGIPYEASAKIPFIIAAPGKVTRSNVISEALGTVDFLPTVLDLLGVPKPDGVQGRSFFNLLTQRSEDAQRKLTEEAGSGDWGRTTILRNAGTKPSWIAAVQDRFKLVLSVSDHPWLFDLDEDPDELRNFMDEPSYAPAASKLALSIRDYAAKFGEPHLKHTKLKEQLDELMREAESPVAP
ncbi:MAG: sulfatase [Planctomycetota bacterium]